VLADVRQQRCQWQAAAAAVLTDTSILPISLWAFSVVLQAAVELCWLTCVSSALNGEELTRAGGVTILGTLLVRTVGVLPADALPTTPGAVIATHCLRTFAGMAAFASARAELAERCVF